MERINIMSFGVVLLKLLMLPLFTFACLRKKVHVRVGSRGDQGADVSDGVRLHSSSSTWCGCIRVVFVCLLFSS
jgi:phosphoglycerate-specific signal transduction histidine kinase